MSKQPPKKPAAKPAAPKKPTEAQANAIISAFVNLESAIETLRELGFATREIALTITNAEQASFWLQYAANELDLDLEEDEDDDEGDDEDDEEGE